MKGIYEHKKGYERPPFSEEWKANISAAKKANPTRYWLGKKRPGLGLGRKMSDEAKHKMSLAKLGKPSWNAGLIGYQAGETSPHWKGGIPPCITCGKVRTKYGTKTPYCSPCFNKATMKGEGNPNWNGGVSKKNKTERQLFMETIPYKEWRKAVFQRDNYTCVLGDKSHGEKLNADHIKPYVLFPELRLDVSNGRTLCVPCHKRIGWSFFREQNPRRKLLKPTIH